ncbi:hypothetical protein NV379_03765 [Paenibacillus sp. N1-5-1-14]|uniref:hypothetical protein n=1 Tax=Paenibacillus radicibacter TaxID=2972488 RepID=UPI002159A891|nr:hypothetical protein [Paenibacillus radicibacter]MCR8641767.1 hypothetical protein [Paenibacillus radicibacter]
MSKKLEKNGLWESSRMMLPQHKEILIERRKFKLGDDKEERVYPTAEELELMKDSVLLPVMHAFVLKRVEVAKHSSEPLRELYVKTAELLAKYIQIDLIQVKRSLVEKKIVVMEEEKDECMLHYRYKYRGHEDRFTITRDYMRAEIGMRVRGYADGLVTGLYHMEKPDKHLEKKPR